MSIRKLYEILSSKLLAGRCPIHFKQIALDNAIKYYVGKFWPLDNDWECS